jgi:hypothetical protein
MFRSRNFNPAATFFVGDKRHAAQGRHADVGLVLVTLVDLVRAHAAAELVPDVVQPASVRLLNRGHVREAALDRLLDFNVADGGCGGGEVVAVVIRGFDHSLRRRRHRRPVLRAR